MWDKRGKQLFKSILAKHLLDAVRYKAKVSALYVISLSQIMSDLNKIAFLLYPINCSQILIS